VVDLAKGSVVQTIPVGDKPIAATIDSDAHTIYVTNKGSGTVSVIDTVARAVVATVAVGDNQAVKAGDVLVTIDSDDFSAKVAEAEASRAATEASIGTIDSQIIWQQTKIDQIVAQQRSAGAELTRAKTVYDRYKKLIESKVIGTQDLDEATAAYVKAQAAVSETSAELGAEK
jgi:membrane fusion protein (multidrug efflux system)